MMIKVNTQTGKYTWVNSSLVTGLTINGAGDTLTVYLAGNFSFSYNPGTTGADSFDTVAGNINAVTNTVTLANDISLSTTGTLS